MARYRDIARIEPAPLGAAYAVIDTLADPPWSTQADASSFAGLARSGLEPDGGTGGGDSVVIDAPDLPGAAIGGVGLESRPAVARQAWREDTPRRALMMGFVAVLLVANTIRLAAFARRKEIGIMRLVGASTLYIALPFLLEALVTALISVALAGGALAAFLHFAIRDLASNLRFVPWISWDEFWLAAGAIAILGPVLTLIPTLVLTRKYLKV